MPISVLVWLLHAYVAWRIGGDLPSVGAGAVFAALLVGSALLLPSGFVHRRASARGTPRLRVAALVVLGLVSTLFVLTLLRDVALGVAWTIDAAFGASLPLEALATWSAVAVPLLALLASAIGFANARRTARIVRIDIPVDGLPAPLDGFTVAQISDVHVGPTIRKPEVEAIVAAVNRLDADMVAITGDLVDGSVAELGAHVAPLAGLKSRSGTFFVTGNHEYYSGAGRWIVALGRLGIRVLLNEHVTLERGDARVVVAGVTDVSAGHFDRSHASDPDRALAGSPHGAFRILLAHQPRSAAAAERAGADLQLSGHTHGGQFWPWNHFVRLQQPFTAGLARLGRMWVYTSRGTGYWGPPKRVGAPSEITLLRLVRAAG